MTTKGSISVVICERLGSELSSVMGEKSQEGSYPVVKGLHVRIEEIMSENTRMIREKPRELGTLRFGRREERIVELYVPFKGLV